MWPEQMFICFENKHTEETKYIFVLIIYLFIYLLKLYRVFLPTNCTQSGQNSKNVTTIKTLNYLSSYTNLLLIVTIQRKGKA